MSPMSSPLALGGGVPLPSVPELEPSEAVRSASRVLRNVLLAFVAALLALYAGFHAYVAWKLAHPDVAPLASNPMLAKNLPYEDIAFFSADGKTLLDGWWIPAKDDSRRSIVLSHGYGTNREESWVPMYDLADLIHGLGYNVLMFDYGYASAKQRLPATGGVLESQQLLGAIHYARERGSDELIVWGFSMGAGTALQAALQHAPVDAMILDSTFLVSDETLVYNLVHSGLKLPKYPTVNLVKWFLPLVSGTAIDKVPAAQAQDTPFDFPVFLIHGTADRKAPAYLAENVAKAQTNPYTQLWIVNGAIHEMIFRTHTQEYIARATAFLGEDHAETAAKRLQLQSLDV